jgi:hypothetical protein
MVQPGASGDATDVPSAERATPDPSPADLEGEYVYVVSDLRRIGAIAAAMVALLVVLAVLLM